MIEYMKLQLAQGKPIDREDELITRILRERRTIINETTKADMKKYIRILFGKDKGDLNEAKQILAYLFKLDNPELLSEFGFDLPKGGRRKAQKRRYQNRKTLKAKKPKSRSKSLKVKRRTV
jgi:hypothetical protein